MSTLFWLGSFGQFWGTYAMDLDLQPWCSATWDSFLPLLLTDVECIALPQSGGEVEVPVECVCVCDKGKQIREIDHGWL